MTHATLPTVATITGRFTFEQLVHELGPSAWPSGVPETVDVQEREGALALLHQAEEYLDGTPSAVALDINEGQVLNVVMHP